MKKDDRIGRFERFKRLRYQPTDRPTDQPTDRPTDQPTDMTSYRSARTHLKTRPDTRLIPVADGWAGAEMHVFALSNSITSTDRRTERRTDKASYRVACPQLKTMGHMRMKCTFKFTKYLLHLGFKTFFFSNVKIPR